MTVPGTVTGILAVQVFPAVVSVTPVIVLLVGSVIHVRAGAQLSLVIRLMNEVAIFREVLATEVEKKIRGMTAHIVMLQ